MFVFLTEVLRRVLRAKREREIEELEIKFECEKSKIVTFVAADYLS